MAEGSASVNQDVRALPTNYQGVLFRSRIEARWAVFFDRLGVPWEYEPEGFDLGEGVWYLPDFWLPQERIWLEVKPTPELSPEDKRKVDAFAQLTIEDAAAVWSPRQFGLLIGSPRPDESERPYAGSEHITLYPDWDNAQAWAACPRCRRIGLAYSGWAERLCDCFPSHHKCSGDSERINRAAMAAVEARFVR